MGYYCTVPQCTSLAGKTKNVKFHRFPRDEVMADKWNGILKRGKPYTKYSKVCSLHFTQGDYNVTTMGQWKTLSKDAVPTQNLPRLNPDGSVMVIRKSRTVKYREGRREDSEKDDKWQMPLSHPLPLATPAADAPPMDPHDNVLYRLQTLGHMSTPMPQQLSHSIPKPRKQDAIMQTDPVQNEDDDTQPNNSYSEVSDKSHTSELDNYTYKDENYPKEAFPKETYQKDYPKEVYQKDGTSKDYQEKEPEKRFVPKDYTKSSDYIPQTNEEYNKEAEKYALERKSHNGYDKDYLKLNEYRVDLCSYEKYREGYSYQNGYTDTADLLRNQQHNLMLQEREHRMNEGFDHIKQEIDINDEEKYNYERSMLEADQYERRMQHQRMMDQIGIKQEPETSSVDPLLMPPGSPYYTPNGHANVTGSFYEPVTRPGPELLRAKQNALAVHQQLWQNTMKRPFFYSDSAAHYSAPPLLHRYDDMSRILQ